MLSVALTLQTTEANMSKGNEQKAPVTARALIHRINRRLEEKQQMVRRGGEGRTRNALGEYYVIDLKRNVVIRQHVDLQVLCLEVDVLRPWEQLDVEGASEQPV
jgi:hypothetical protein